MSLSLRWASARSGGVDVDGVVPPSAGTSPAWPSLRPSSRLYAVAPIAVAVRAVLTSDMPATPCCLATRSELEPSWPMLPMSRAPIAPAFTGVHLFQPASATQPACFGSSTAPAAALRPTAPISEPPNQAARPASCRVRVRVLVATGSPERTRGCLVGWCTAHTRPGDPHAPYLSNP